ncbi:MAG: proline--tRNA ligase, partial [Proteobacteria bacterium]|nr:proline--tRNA ligase [Pseudomonadota bacterium]
MRASQFFIYSDKSTPAEAEIISHQLMLRARLIRKVASGIYSWLPMGWRVVSKISEIVREEMDAA